MFRREKWYDVLGPLLMLCFLTVHIVCFLDNYSEIKLIILFGIIGTMIDTSMAYSEILIYNGKYTPNTFCSTLDNLNVVWLFRNNQSFLTVVASSLFCICPFRSSVWPAILFTGIKFGAIEFDAAPIIALLIIAIFYGLTIPIMYCK